jgi:uncharacterized protein with HEPN domain
MTRESNDYLDDIVQAMEHAIGFTRGMTYAEFEDDPRTSAAVVRMLEIVGEAVKKIPDGVRKNEPDVPWREIAAMRDRLIHEYFGVDLEIVWDTAKNDIPSLLPAFERLRKSAA